ncbi:MAG: AAA domain-containing protein [Desulfobacterales bacterium]|nr:AAA domain-containing protein [Desulfobacterales bacterium]
MSFKNKDLEAALYSGHSIFSCLQILRRFTSCPQSQYIDVLKAVRSSMNNGDVTFSWRGVERRRNESKSPSPSHPFRASDRLSKLLSSQTLAWLGLKKSDSDSQELIHSVPDWETFRKFLRYLIECVQHEAGAVAIQYDEKEGDQFVYLPRHGDWMPRFGKPFTGFVPPQSRHTGFLNRLAAMDPSTPFVLGYPVEILVLQKSHDDIPPSAIVRPVFQFKLSYDARRRCFFAIDPIPEVNLSWLNNSLRKKDQQKAFLTSCGFMDVNADAESLLGGVSQSLRHMTSTLSAMLFDQIREPLISHSVSGDSLQGMKSGIYNRAVLMLGKHGRYVKTLLSELAHIAERPEEELERTALGALFLNKCKQDDPDPRLDHASTLMDMLPLNAEQRQAVTSLQQANISVVTGPPGTGKSQVAAAAMAGMRLRGKSVLFASKNHKAVDAVMGRLQVEDGRPYVIRANSKDDPNLKITFRTMIRLLLEGSHNHQAELQCHALLEQADGLLRLRGERACIAREIENLKNCMSEHEEVAAFHSMNLSDELCRALGERYAKYPSGWVGEVERILEILLTGSRAKRIGAHARLFLLRMKKRLMCRLMGMPTLSCASRNGGLTGLADDLATLRRAELYATALQGAHEVADKFRPLPGVDVLSSEIADLSEKIQEITQRALPLDLAARGTGLPSGGERERLANLRSALGSLSSGMMGRNVEQSILDQAQRDIELLLSHFPCWAVTNLSVGSRLPLVAGMFDLAILDEASQCDMASVIPVLYRARRAGVIGDPFQLRHIAHIGMGQDALIRQRVGLSEYSLSRFSYANTSLYDLFVEANGVEPVFLSETYRSHADIADYSNELFYDNRLRVAVDPLRLSVPTGMRPGLHWTPVVAEIRSGGPSGCHCPEECNVVIQQIVVLLESGFRGSIGVVTPFRQQANRINDALYEQGISQDTMRETRLHVDTSHGFQGDERDVMFFSLCAGPDMPKGSIHFLKEQGYLFNVAVSRARAVLHVVGNRSWACSCGIKHIERLAVERTRGVPREAQGPWAPHDSPWEKVLYKALVERGLEPVVQYPIAGRRLDLALLRTGDRPLKIDIEVDGDRYHRNPDGSRKQGDIWRDYQIKSLGWRVKRFWVYQLRENLHECVDSIFEIWRDTDDIS